MSRGPGRLQTRILAELASADEDGLSRSELYQLLPDADPANLRRAIRSLKKMGYLVEEHDAYHQERWVRPVRVESVPFDDEWLAEILASLQETGGTPRCL